MAHGCVKHFKTKKHRDTNFMEAITINYQRYIDWVSSLSPATFWFPLRVALTLLIMSGVCSLIFIACSRRLPPKTLMVFQWAFALWAAMMSMQISFNQLNLQPLDKMWYFTFSIIAILTLPFGLSWLLAYKEGWRRILLRVIYLPILFAFILNLFQS